MKKLLVVLLLTAAGTAVFAGGKSATTGGGGVTLTGYLQIDLANPQYEYWVKTLEEFGKAYPEIKLDLEWRQRAIFPMSLPVMPGPVQTISLNAAW